MKTFFKTLLELPAVLLSRTFLLSLFREFIDKGCQRSAAALTYMTLFALVPLITVFYAMFSVVPAFEGLAEKLQTLIFSHFVPATGEEVQRYLSSFSQQARSLTAFGIAMLVVTAYLMLTNIEKTFNTIWGVKRARKGMSSFLLYWAILSLGPLLLGTGLVISTYVLSLKLLAGVDLLGIKALMLGSLPLVFTSFAFTLLFAAVPNCYVPLKLAVVGGIMTAVLFELTKIAFGYLIAKSSFELVYGAFAAVPLFLLWINIMWTLILVGAVFVRTLAEKDYRDHSKRFTNFWAAMKCVHLFYLKSFKGLSVNDKDCVALGMGLVRWHSLREVLVEHGWIAITENDRYVLSRNLAEITTWDLAKIIGMSASEHDELSESQIQKNRGDEGEAWPEKILNAQKRLAEEGKRLFSQPLNEVFSEAC